jgi:hypothetical protein
MKRFKQFIIEAEVTPAPAQQAAPAGDPIYYYSLPPGVPGTQQHGPPSPEPERPRVIPEAPLPGSFENFEDFWKAYQRWLYERGLGIGDLDLDWDRYYKFVRDEWKRYMRERPNRLRNPPPAPAGDEFDLEPVIPEA